MPTDSAAACIAFYAGRHKVDDVISQHEHDGHLRPNALLNIFVARVNKSDICVKCNIIRYDELKR